MTETVLDRYILVQKIGAGGMGDVYRGTDRRTDTSVAIKVLKSEHATPEMIQRFVREGEALRQLNHPNIVKLLDTVHENGRYYLVMELVEGGALDDLLMRSPRLPVNEVLNIALDLADALTRAHRLNIIHRDIKPANVLLTNDGMLRLTDFGIARVIGSDSNITEEGSVIGTIAYIAPEVLQGKPADARSDIWSMGLMLFEMLAGEHPFASEDGVGGMIRAILDAAPPDLEALRPDVPTALVDAINRMVMKNPDERIPRMRLVGAELETILTSTLTTSTTTSSMTMTSTMTETHQTQVVVRVSEGSRFETPVEKVTQTRRHNLPVQTTPFVGREAELDELEKLLRDDSVRLLSIVGPGGMGKTRISLEVASKFLRPTHHDKLFEHGIYFIDLAPVTSPDHIVGAAAEAVGYIFQQDGRDPKQQLFDYLMEKNALLILDNFEHVIAGRAFAQEVLQAAPSIKILVTSREKLNLNSETVFILSGMGFPNWETPADALEYGAVKLFLQSAHRVRHDFRLDGDSLTYVARICRMVQGTPLGILLAASWLEVLTPHEIAEEISRSLDFLETEMQDVPQRQRSLRAVFEYSWNLLTEQEQMLFAKFSIFHGGFTRDAALEITGTSLRGLTVLVSKSLLRRDNVSGRYEIHELLRQYAEEKLKQSAELESSYRAHSRYYLNLLIQLAPKLKGFGQLDALNMIDIDFENIRAAWMWALEARDAEQVEAAIEGLYLYLTFRNRFMDGDQMFGAARKVWNADGNSASALAGKLLVRFPQTQPPIIAYRAGLAIAQQHGDPAEIAFCQRLVGHWLSHTEFNQTEGIPMMETALSAYQALGNKFYAAQILDDLGWSYQLNLDLVMQGRLVQQSLVLRREIGDKIGTANSLRNLGGSYGGYFDTSGSAFKCWEEAKQIAYEMNDRLLIAWNASLQAAIRVFEGEFEQAEALVDEATPHAFDMNAPTVKGMLFLARGIIAALRDEDYATARSLLDEWLTMGVQPDVWLFGALAMVVITCGLHDLQVCRRHVQAFSKSTPYSANEFIVPIFVPSRIEQLIQQGELMRAAEIDHYYATYKPTISGRQFPLGWVRRWALWKRMDDQLKAELGASYPTALERGEQLSEADLAQEVRTYLNSMLE